MNNKEGKFNTEIARLCGVNAAVVASKLWEAQANADSAIYIDGYPWVRASYNRITAFLPFLTVHMVQTAVKKLLREDFNDYLMHIKRQYPYNDNSLA